MQQIPLEATPNQRFSVVLGGQDCTIDLYARGSGDATRLYCDLAVSGVQIWSGTLCHNLVDLKSFPSRLFSGALWFVDTRGDSDPVWEELGERYALLYAAEGETPAGVQSADYQGAASAAQELTA